MERTSWFRKANKISSSTAKRGTRFHQHVEDYLRQDKDFIEFEDVLQEQMFRAVRPVLDEIVPLALEAPMYSENLKDGRTSGLCRYG